MRKRLSQSIGTQKGIWVALLLLIAVWGTRAGTLPLINPMSQQPPQPVDGKERIYIEQVNLWYYDKEINPEAQILVGNVLFRHKNAYMYCDSALLYEQKNRFEAYGNVRIEQGDSLRIYCNYLDYDGFTLVARLRELVRMEHGENTLYTDSLDYDRKSGVGYYFDYGTIVDSLNVLSSIYGEYATHTKVATFNDSVVLENPNFTMYSDTLRYDTTTKLATIYGPTKIVSDSGVIHTTKGVYDTEKDRAYLMDRAELTSDSRWMTGDSLYYDRVAKQAQMYGNVILRDTLEKVELRGEYAEYNEETGYGLAKENAYVVDYSSEQDSLFAHALKMEMVKVDSLTTLVKGVENVRVYRSDIQAIADTMVYHSKDSVMHCLGTTFVWSGKSQITGDTISLHLKNGAMHHAHIRENAYLSNEVDTKGHYDQMRGREVFAYFTDNKIDSVLTKGNAEVIYYTLSEDSVALEHITSQSSALLMHFVDEEIYKIKLLDKTVGVITPVPLLKPDQLTYPNFVWFPQARPTSFKDIFRRTPPIGSSGGGDTEGKEENADHGNNELLQTAETQ